jgi:hypothetical protein
MGALLRSAIAGRQGAADSGGAAVKWDRSDGLVPQGGTRLLEVFEEYYRQVTPNWGELDAAIETTHARRTSAKDAPKNAEAILTKADEAEFSRALSEPERAFWNAEKAFYAAHKARDDAREAAAGKFIAALAAGELRAMVRKNGTNYELPPKIWHNKTDFFVELTDRGPVRQHPLLFGLDAIIDDGRARVVFVDAGRFQDWFVKQGAAAGDAVPKVGPRGGRPSSMAAIEAELDRWIAGGSKLILERMRHWAPEKPDTRSKGRLARALSNWCEKNGGSTTQNRIEQALSEKLNKAFELISSKI